MLSVNRECIFFMSHAKWLNCKGLPIMINAFDLDLFIML
jgi:hypothetical protein